MSNATQDSEYYEDPYIHTIAGRFYLSNPTFDAVAIAHALGMLCRFNGNTRRFYSVAEHSCLVADLMDQIVGGDPFEGLMHDAAEAYLSDIPTPFKRLLPDWRALEGPLEEELRTFYNLPLQKSKECEYADKLALFLEAINLIPEGGEDYLDPLGMREYALKLNKIPEWRPRCWSPKRAGAVWLKHFNEYGR